MAGEIPGQTPKDIWKVSATPDVREKIPACRQAGKIETDRISLKFHK